MAIKHLLEVGIETGNVLGEWANDPDLAGGEPVAPEGRVFVDVTDQHLAVGVPGRRCVDGVVTVTPAAKKIPRAGFFQLFTPQEYYRLFVAPTDPGMIQGAAVINSVPDIDPEHPIVAVMLAYCVMQNAQDANTGLTEQRAADLLASMRAAAV